MAERLRFSTVHRVKIRPLHELVSENLHRIADERGIRLVDIAELAGIDRREFLAVLAGELEGDLDWLNMIAAAVGVDTTALVVDLYPEPKDPS